MNPLWLQAFFRIYHTPPYPIERPFNYETDRFAFANETVWNYVAGEVRPESERAVKKEKPYTHHCFVMVRAAMQFWKFARFEPTTKPVSNEEMARRINQVCWRYTWLPPLSHDQRVVFPGYSNLLEITTAKPGLFQDNIGMAWPIYWRVGNFPICIPVTPQAKARLNEQILLDLDAGYPTLLWLYNFPSLSINHTVMPYQATRDGNIVRYRVYDPNYGDASKEMQFDLTTNIFTFEPTFYFKGGSVTPRAIYRGFFE